jgi:hypothetical protein
MYILTILKLLKTFKSYFELERVRKCCWVVQDCNLNDINERHYSVLFCDIYPIMSSLILNGFYSFAGSPRNNECYDEEMRGMEMVNGER